MRSARTARRAGARPAAACRASRGLIGSRWSAASCAGRAVSSGVRRNRRSLSRVGGRSPGRSRSGSGGRVPAPVGWARGWAGASRRGAFCRSSPRWTEGSAEPRAADVAAGLSAAARRPAGRGPAGPAGPRAEPPAARGRGVALGVRLRARWPWRVTGSEATGCCAVATARPRTEAAATGAGAGRARVRGRGRGALTGSERDVPPALAAGRTASRGARLGLRLIRERAAASGSTGRLALLDDRELLLEAREAPEAARRARPRSAPRRRPAASRQRVWRPDRDPRRGDRRQTGTRRATTWVVATCRTTVRSVTTLRATDASRDEGVLVDDRDVGLVDVGHVGHVDVDRGRRTHHQGTNGSRGASGNQPTYPPPPPIVTRGREARPPPDEGHERRRVGDARTAGATGTQYQRERVVHPAAVVIRRPAPRLASRSRSSPRGPARPSDPAVGRPADLDARAATRPSRTAGRAAQLP